MNETATPPATEPTAPPKPQGRERRVARRRQPKGGTRVACRKGTLGLGQNIAVQVLDLSETGIRLMVRTALATGDDVEFELVTCGQPRPIKLVARIAWAVPASDGNYCIGARFEKELKYRDLLQMTTFAV